MMGVLCALSAALTLHVALAANGAASDGKTARADSIVIGGAVEHPRVLTLADLQREPVTTETVSLKTGKGVLRGSYTGVLLWTLLQQAVIKVSGAKNDVIRHTVVVASGDGYATVLSAAEIDPQFGGERAIIAYAKDGQPLTDKRGFARLILPADQEAARAISGVASITVQ
ncbi:MAG TPA: molybdopterin-dependent oxidoreductase [Steroidobacteraceae bacterium]|nr:molybdopterin-dependent oxidoreductase [Steroidobacteraceae bacterium]